LARRLKLLTIMWWITCSLAYLVWLPWWFSELHFELNLLAAIVIINTEG